MGKTKITLKLTALWDKKRPNKKLCVACLPRALGSPAAGARIAAALLDAGANVDAVSDTARCVARSARPALALACSAHCRPAKGMMHGGALEYAMRMHTCAVCPARSMAGREPCAGGCGTQVGELGNRPLHVAASRGSEEVSGGSGAPWQSLAVVV